MGAASGALSRDHAAIHGEGHPAPALAAAYGRDYRYNGSVLTVPPILAPFLTWTVEMIDARLNGLLLNWYDAAQLTTSENAATAEVGLVHGSPIVTISLGEGAPFWFSGRTELRRKPVASLKRHSGRA